MTGDADEPPESGGLPGGASRQPDADDVMSALIGDAMRDQRLRQERLWRAQQFLTSPLFVDLRDRPLEVSDPPEAIAERARDLDYRIAVLESVLALLREERGLLDRAVSPASGA